jgi:hypothetical protein
VPGKTEPPIGDRPPLIECDLPLGRPGAVAHNELVLSGWAASPKGISGVAVQVGDRVWNASYGLDTPAVAERLPDLPGAERSGYRLQIDTSGWEPGPHYVTVAAFDLEGGRSAVEGQVEVSPFAEPRPLPPAGLAELADDEVALAVDPPLSTAGTCEIAGPLEVSGWAYAKDGIEAVVVTLDGGLQYEAPRPAVRPDLLDRFGRAVAEDAGFVLRLHPADCPPGRHTLSVAAVSREGHSAGFEYDLLCSPEPESVAIDSGSPLAAGDLHQSSDDADMWRSRALLAEADAALSRAEANLARRAQEATLRALRDAAG